MRGLTLHRPVDWAMAHGGKDLENRRQKPPRSVIGQRIALHAGNEYKYEYADWIKRVLGIDVIPDTRPGVIVATTLIVGWLCVGSTENRKAGLEVIATKPEYVALRESKWFLGPYAWVCAETIALPKPVVCRGWQGLWPVPPDKERLVLEQEQRARAAA
jgi:hypothetical protein